MRDPKTILITGASSGIGAALAKAFAQPGRTLLLNGRNPTRLTTVAAGCRQRGAQVRELLLEVTDGPGLDAWMRAQHERNPLDLVVANAGISADAGESAEQARRTFATNVDGVLNTIQPAIELILTKPRPKDGSPRGQVALMSSLAAFRGFAGAPAYCGSKAALKAYGESLRTYHAADGIEVSVICPGFVRTPMTDVNKFPMPFLMSAENAARIIVRNLQHNHGRIAFPWPSYIFAWFLSVLPPQWTDRLIAGMPRKTHRT